MPEGAFTVNLPDGRLLECWASTESGQPAVLFHVGTPSAGIPFAPLVAAARQRGFGFVTYSRPGYAGSTRLAGRSVADCADDVAALLDARSLGRVTVVGWSGGGFHALACAALLPEQVTAAVTLAGVAPWDAEGLAWLAGMAEANLAEFAATVEGQQALLRFLEPIVADRLDVTAEGLVAGLGGLLTDVDRAALTGEFAEFLAVTNRAAISAGPWGWLDDDLAFVRDWGFELADIGVPVTIWHGRHDAMVPTTHGEWLAHQVPGARCRILDDEGHLSLVLRFGAILEDAHAHAA